MHLCALLYFFIPDVIHVPDQVQTQIVNIYRLAPV